jgi:pimeloyl-ACP methyl ester carboxylesterase
MSACSLIRRAVVVTAISALAGLLAACGNKTSTAEFPRHQDVVSTETDVRMNDCAAQCRGELDGAQYTIKLPIKWNGTLLLYSHGYRFALPTPPNFDQIETHAQVSSTDGDGSGFDPLSKKLLSQGYALAGSSYKSNGWAVADGVKAGKDLHDRFVKLVGKPKRTYVWGDSLGGLITEVLAETNPDWVDGSAPMCGAVAGPNDNFDIAFDVAYAVKALIDPGLKLSNFASPEEAADNWKHAADAVQAAATDVAGGGTAKILFIASLVDAPTKSARFDGHDVPSQVKARVEALLTALSFGTSGRYELEQRVGGNPSDNTTADYTKRISGSEATLISAAGGDVAALQKELDSEARVAADVDAREAIESLGDTTGTIAAPTVTMHTEADPLVLVQNESVLASRTYAARRSSNLVQLYVSPPSRFSESTKAPYGAGHCNFSDQQRVGLISILDTWVRQAARPAPVAIKAALGLGYDADFVVGAWPRDP